MDWQMHQYQVGVSLLQTHDGRVSSMGRTVVDNPEDPFGSPVRDKGRPVAAGSSQAKALTWTTTSGGENGRAPGSRFISQTSEAFLKEALAPFADDLSRDRQGGADLVVGQALSRQEDHLRAHDFIIR